MKPALIASLFTLLLTIVVPAALPVSALAETQPVMQTPENLRTPIIILRFNQRNVYFQKSLAMVIRRAVQTKPDVVFDVVNIIPKADYSEEGNPPGSKAEQNLSNVISVFHSNGIDNSRIMLARQPAPVGTDEIHIYVR